MSMRHTTLLILAALFAVGDAVLPLHRSIDSKPIAPNPTISPSIAVSMTPAKRLLRSHEAEDSEEIGTYNNERDEERSSIPGLSRLAMMTFKLDNPSAHNLAIKMLLSGGSNPREVFKLLLLGEAGAKLEIPKIIQWFKFVKRYQADQGAHRFTAKDAYALLTSKRTEEEVAVLFASLKKVPGMEKLAEDLQKVQFDSWRSKDTIPSALGGVSNKLGENIWEEYAKYTARVRGNAVAE